MFILLCDSKNSIIEKKRDFFSIESKFIQKIVFSLQSQIPVSKKACFFCYPKYQKSLLFFRPQLSTNSCFLCDFEYPKSVFSLRSQLSKNGGYHNAQKPKGVCFSWSPTPFCEKICRGKSLIIFLAGISACLCWQFFNYIYSK